MAHEQAEHSKKDLVLPVAVVSTTDVGRLNRELGSLEEALVQLKLRKGGHTVTMPKTSMLMDKTIELNKLNLLHAEDRARLKSFLEGVRTSSPVMHISFGADPSPLFLEKLMSWLRREVHANLLLSIGLQPTIGAGCMVRTTNKVFDLTLRRKFTDSRGMLREKILAAEAKA